jgi:hypothetical protein
MREARLLLTGGDAVASRLISILCFKKEKPTGLAS